MDVTQTILLVVQVFTALTLIGFILVQHGKGADAGAAFGSGASGTVFGSRGSSNFLTKVTTILAVVFLVNSLALGYLAAHKEAPGSLMEDQALTEQVSEKQAMKELETMLKAAEEQAEADMTSQSDVPDWTPDAPASDAAGSDIPELPAE